MKYCSECGANVEIKVPEGDHFPRYVCTACNTIHYQNPKVITGCIATWDNKILMCRRGIEPRYGKWTIPAGFMENHETLQEGAARETMKEAQAKVTNLKLFGVFNIPHISQVYVMFKGEMVNEHNGSTPESLETQLMTEAQIPWQELAFPVVHESLRLYFSNKQEVEDKVHFGDIIRDEQDQVTIKHY